MKRGEFMSEVHVGLKVKFDLPDSLYYNNRTAIVCKDDIRGWFLEFVGGGGWCQLRFDGEKLPSYLKPIKE